MIATVSGVCRVCARWRCFMRRMMIMMRMMVVVGIMVMVLLMKWVLSRRHVRPVTLLQHCRAAFPTAVDSPTPATGFPAYFVGEAGGAAPEEEEECSDEDDGRSADDDADNGACGKPLFVSWFPSVSVCRGGTGSWVTC